MDDMPVIQLLSLRHPLLYFADELGALATAAKLRELPASILLCKPYRRLCIRTENEGIAKYDYKGGTHLVMGLWHRNFPLNTKKRTK